LVCSPQAFYAIFLGTPIYLLIGVPRQARIYFTFLAILAELATIGAALGLAVGALVKDVPVSSIATWRVGMRVEGRREAGGRAEAKIAGVRGVGASTVVRR
jgi:hypothetical protein